MSFFDFNASHKLRQKILIMPEEQVKEKERELRKYYNSTKDLDEDLKKILLSCIFK